MKSIPIERLGYLAALWLCGTLALAATTWVCFQFQLNLATTSLAYLIVIVLLSLLDSLISSIVLSVVAVALLNYFFVEPLFTLQVEYAQDSAALIVFVITSIVITSLVRCVRNLANTQREQARLLDLTRDTIIVRGMDDAITYWIAAPKSFMAGARMRPSAGSPRTCCALRSRRRWRPSRRRCSVTDAGRANSSTRRGTMSGSRSRAGGRSSVTRAATRSAPWRQTTTSPSADAPKT